jgi:CMP-N-acetylneuraminic acid synthetase
MKEDFTIVIPARRNSKGLPFKNRKLISLTLATIPNEFKSKVVINTDDEFLIQNCMVMGLKYYKRPKKYATDKSSTKSVILDMINSDQLNGNVIMLYLTYPERTWDDIIKAYDFFKLNNSKSLLCKKEIIGTHPYLYMLDVDDIRGKQLKKHNLYRRQDYPKVFEISHYISIFNTNEVKYLNNNLYNKETIYYKINNNIIDIDYISDLDKVIKK